MRYWKGSANEMRMRSRTSRRLGPIATHERTGLTADRSFAFARGFTCWSDHPYVDRYRTAFARIASLDHYQLRAFAPWKFTDAPTASASRAKPGQLPGGWIRHVERMPVGERATTSARKQISATKTSGRSWTATGRGRVADPGCPAVVGVHRSADGRARAHRVASPRSMVRSQVPATLAEICGVCERP